MPWGKAKYSPEELKERRRASDRRYKEKNRELLTLKRSERRRKNAEKERETQRRWREKNRDRINEKHREYQRSWNVQNREKVLAAKRRYNQNARMIAISPKCINCESILKFNEITVCDWCDKTYVAKKLNSVV